MKRSVTALAAVPGAGMTVVAWGIVAAAIAIFVGTLLVKPKKAES